MYHTTIVSATHAAAGETGMERKRRRIPRHHRWSMGAPPARGRHHGLVPIPTHLSRSFVEQARWGRFMNRLYRYHGPHPPDRRGLNGSWGRHVRQALRHLKSQLRVCLRNAVASAVGRPGGDSLLRKKPFSRLRPARPRPGSFGKGRERQVQAGKAEFSVEGRSPPHLPLWSWLLRESSSDTLPVNVQMRSRRSKAQGTKPMGLTATRGGSILIWP